MAEVIGSIPIGSTNLNFARSGVQGTPYVAKNGGVAAEISFESQLADGTPVHFRRVRLSDKAMLAGGFQELSPESRYRRFFRHLDHLSEEQLRYLTEVDFQDHFVWLATTDDTGLGIGRWIRLAGEPDVAEAAVTVVDAYQGRGIGTTLLRLLVLSAIERDVTRFRAWVLGDNHEMMEILQRLGALRGRWDSGVYEVDVPLPKDVAELEATPAPLILKATAAGELQVAATPQTMMPRFGHPDAPETGQEL